MLLPYHQLCPDEPIGTHAPLTDRIEVANIFEAIDAALTRGHLLMLLHLSAILGREPVIADVIDVHQLRISQEPLVYRYLYRGAAILDMDVSNVLAPQYRVVEQ